MILLAAVIVGLPAGLVRAWWRGRPVSSPHLKLVWLAILGFLPQWFAFYLAATRGWVPDDWARFALVSSLLMLLVFAWANRRLPGFWLLGLGLALNLVVIVLNGGLMPINPETVARLSSNAPPSAWQIAGRLGTGKDIVLAVENIRLEWLSDRFLLPDWVPYHVAFSLGDTLIAAGAFWLLWALGGEHAFGEKENRIKGNLGLGRTQWQRTESIDQCGRGE